MANQKIPTNVMLDICHNIDEMAQRPARALGGTCPLANSDVQLLLMNSRDLDMCDDLYARSVSGIDKASSCVLRFNRSEVPEGRKPLDRDLLIHFHGLSVFYPKPTNYTPTLTENDIMTARSKDYVNALLGRVGAGTWDKFVPWANAMTRAERRRQLVKWFVNRLTNGVADTTTLHILWPQIATFVSDPRWRDRINKTSIRTTRYVPDPGKLALSRKYSHAVEEILADCALSYSPKDSSNKVVTLRGWEFLPGEWKPA